MEEMVILRAPTRSGLVTASTCSGSIAALASQHPLKRMSKAVLAHSHAEQPAWSQQACWHSAGEIAQTGGRSEQPLQPQEGGAGTEYV